jgi:hypothetical protein
VVALIMPSLTVLSHTRAYSTVRIALAGFGVALATAWLADHTTLTTSNAPDGISAALVQHPFLMAACLACVAAATWAVPRLRTEPGVQAGREGYQTAVWVPFVLPPMLVLFAVVLQAIETRLLGNGPGRTRSAEQADVVIPPGPTVRSASSSASLG